MVAPTRPSSSSPPAKRLREVSPSVSNGTVMLKSEATTKVDNEIAHQDQQNKQEKNAAKNQARRLKVKRKDRERSLEKMGEEPIFFDICDMLGMDSVDAILKQGPRAEWAEKFTRGEEVSIRIERLSAHGDGLAVAPSGDWVIVVPHCLPGEKVLARIYSNERLYSKASLIQIEERVAGGSQQHISRRDDIIGCKYFGQCSGCQYQMLDYSDQLILKQDVVSRAFRNFSKLDEDQIPPVLPTLPSPLQYKYRTKLTPHFELPSELYKHRRGRKHGQEIPSTVSFTGTVNIGFDQMGSGKQVLDIEECPIATKTINNALPAERERIRQTITSFKNGATLLMRDSLRSFDSLAEDRSTDQIADTESISNHKSVVKERVGELKFESPAGSFFQNNRSILPSLLDYVREQIEKLGDRTQDMYLVDAYCGSGLFAISMAKMFKQVSGVEIDQESIRFAKQNVLLNGLENVDFIAGDAREIFKHINYPNTQTTVIIDPPRRGCDEPFIKQLLALGPRLIVYVSCNVHTQARDVGQIMRGAPNTYDIKSIRGADLFPQTYHVEGVCVLQRILP